MAEVHEVSVEIGGAEIVFETGRMAKQASGAVLVASGDTRVLGTATAGNIRDIDFMPLTVDIEERMYAAGKIPGSFFKREGRAGEKATLIARMIDRPLRPLFPKGWRYETQLVSIPLSIDHDRPYDILAMNGASAALMVSTIPFPTPVGAVRIGKVDGNFVINPSEEQQLTADLDLVVAGTDEAILMVEAGANEITEAEMLDALDIAHGAIKKLCAAQHELAAKVAKPKLEVTAPAVDEDLYGQIQASHGEALDQATSVQDKLERQDATKAVEAQVLEAYSGAPESDTYAEYRGKAQLAFDKLEKNLIRQRIAVHKKRPDGRSENEIRQIDTEVGILPRTHGSALFTRGQTQALSVVALGTTREEMRLDNLGLETSKRYFHHYNFPPFSVGEAGFMRGPKRRDIGHGALAERALVPMIPSQEDFPYTIRVVSDILESNGSSSMASVCGSSLSLMDAGVPIKSPVAGVAMGLIKEGDDYTVLTDIAGVEDHLGDMDFKVAGTENGITALQMDIKITGVTFEILRDALTQAREGRLFILGKMAESITAAAHRAVRVRAAHLVDPDRPRQDRPADRQGRRDDPRPLRRVRGADRRRGRRHRPRLRPDRRAGRCPGRPDPVDDQGGRGRRRVRRPRRSSRRRRSARSSSSPRAPTACCTSPTSRPASGSRRSRRCSTRATRSPSASSRSTRSAAASACAWPRTRRSPASPSRSSRRSAAVAVAAATAATAGRAATGARAATAAAAGARAAAAATATGARAATATPSGVSGPARAPAHHAGLGAAGRHGAHELRAIRGPGLLHRRGVAR